MDIAEPSVTLETIGLVVSIINDLEMLNDLIAPGSASVRLAGFSAPSKIVPLFKASALVLA